MAEDVLAIVHIIDDDVSVRTSLARLLRGVGYTAKTYASADAFLLCAPRDVQGCILLDLEMPGQDGLELQEKLHRQRCCVPVVFMSAYGDVPRTVRAIKGGACDFLVKPLETQKLLAAIEAALSAPNDEGVSVWNDFSSGATLTVRERVVLKGVLEGRINKQLAVDLDLSERTIKSCRAAVMRKLGARSFADLVRLSGSGF